MPTASFVIDPVTVILVTFTGFGSSAFFSTVTLYVPDTPDPSAAVAVIVAVPAPFAVTTPCPDTTATVSSEDFQLTSLLVASAGSTAAFSSAVSPTFSLEAAPVTVIFSTGTTVGVASSSDSMIM